LKSKKLLRTFGRANPVFRSTPWIGPPRQFLFPSPQSRLHYQPAEKNSPVEFPVLLNSQRRQELNRCESSRRKCRAVYPPPKTNRNILRPNRWHLVSECEREQISWRTFWAPGPNLRHSIGNLKVAFIRGKGGVARAMEREKKNAPNCHARLALAGFSDRTYPHSALCGRGRRACHRWAKHWFCCVHSPCAG